ncbi:uncharacterized protein LOC141719717 [Apium graveolens]|uniref:uncharacterized protein LOC141719717 n=1 Tax=Apium graveolens TaxID=4045 RepID=UPI003D78DF90
MSWSRVCKPKNCEGLELKNLKSFNLSMLAKQGWRLLKESSHLISAVMKAKYYPNTSFLDTKVGSNLSYTWRSIMAAIDVIKAGTRKKIGNGRNTNVWGVPWLPDTTDGYDDTCRWDVEVIQDIFQSQDAELIMQIPLPVREVPDSWVGLFDEKGEYTVKSGYRWLQGELEDADTSFWCCDFAKTVWTMTGMAHNVQCWTNASADVVIRNVFDKVSKEQCVQLAASNLLRDWREAQIMVANGHHADGTRQWGRPKAGWVKENVDAAIFQDRSIGCGVVIRNDQGMFLAVRSKKLQGVWSPKEAETLALKEALSWLIELQYKECIVESDSKTLVQIYE